MPVEADKLEIINAALVLIGDEEITALADEGEREDLANAIYEIRLAEALGMARWRFATRQVELVLNGTAPLARWDSAFDLPDGSPDPIPEGIFALIINQGEPAAFDRYGSQIYCNAGANDEVILDYLFRAEEADFTGRFKSAFVDMLAADFALSKDKEMSALLQRQAYNKFKAAASLDAQERRNTRLPVQRFINARRGWKARGNNNFMPTFTSGGSVTDGDYGDITVSLSGTVWTIDNEAVTYEKLELGTQGDLLVAGVGGVWAPLAAGTNTHILRMVAGVPTWGAENSGATLADGDYGDITVSGTGTVLTIDDEAVTLAKMAHVATARFLGRVTAATGDVEALTGTQATTLLDAFTSGLKGLAPASGGGTTNYLRADGTWAEPPGNLEWELVSTFYDFSIDGAAASVETPAFASGYDYRIELIDLSPTGSASLDVDLYEDGAAAYDAEDIRVGSLAAASQASGMVYIECPQTALNSHVFWGVTNLIDNSTDRVIASVRHAGGTDTIGKARVALTAGNFDGGSMKLWRRAI